jgi:hypothetical protein
MKRRWFLPILVLITLVVFALPGLPAAAQAPPTPMLTCVPNSGFIGSSTTVTGSSFSTAFGTEATIALTWDNVSVSSPIAVDNSGGFSRIISVPGGASIGVHTFKATQSLPDNVNLIATALFTLLPPALVLSPTSGFSVVTLMGKGFLPQNEGLPPIIIFWDNVIIPTVPSPLDQYWTGEFTAIISVPTQTVTGNHTVKAVLNAGGLTGNLTAEASFTVIDMRGPQGYGGGGGMGPIGPSGPTGPAGPAGPTGSTGPQGPAGPAGTSAGSGSGGGGTGPEGPRGLQGPVGLPGPAGAQGPQGAIGPAGATGPEGPAAASGAITGISIVALVVALATLALFILNKLKKWIFS